MKFYSTRDKSKTQPYSLKEVAFLGLAPDGGLFMPEYIPQVDMEIVCQKAEQSFAELAFYLADLYFGEEFDKFDLHKAVTSAFNFPVKLKALDKEKYTLELFHGPTYAFKDFGARFMGHILQLLNNQDDELIILTATSGDTGSAVAHGFYNLDGIKVVILYPDGKVSDLQESQMTTLGKNVYALKVNGTFDDCQRMVKEVFNDTEFRKHKNVTSANSINLLRWLPQSFYHFYGYYLWCKQTGLSNPDVVVPSGNYGNLAAALLAKKMGLPLNRFIASSNSNNIIPEFLETGEFCPRPSVHTIANAMDIGNPSNFERMMYLYDDDFFKISSDIKGFWCKDEQIKEAIQTIFDKYNYISDPHSAIGYAASEHYQTNGFWVSTAHAAKFGKVIDNLLPNSPVLPEELANLKNKEKHFSSISADKNILTDFLSKL